MPSRSPRTVVRTLFQALNDRDVDRAVQQLASSVEAVDRTRSTSVQGREAARAQIETGLEAFAPSFSLQTWVSEPPRVSVYWEMTAVHRVTLLEIPPTNQRVCIQGTALFSLRDDKIVRAYHMWDLAGLLRALHLLPELPARASTQ